MTFKFTSKYLHRVDFHVFNFVLYFTGNYTETIDLYNFIGLIFPNVF